MTFVTAGIDSLSGPGAVTWQHFFAGVVRGGLGDGGPGYAAFTQLAASDVEVTATLTTTGLTEFNIDSDNGKLSIDGTGVETAAGDGTPSLRYTPGSKWSQARIYYLLQPGGGTMKCYSGAQSEDSAAVINTNATSNGIGHVDVQIGEGIPGRSYICSKITGKVTLFGSLAILKPGLLLGAWAVAGRTIQQVQAQDSAMRRAWFAETKPTYYFFNGGTNDRGTPASTVQAWLMTIFADMSSGSPATKLYVVQPNEIFDDQGGANPFYDLFATRKTIADIYRTGYIDDRTVLGSYAQAAAAGYMDTPPDKAHPGPTGKKLIGENIAKVIGLISDKADPGRTPY